MKRLVLLLFLFVTFGGMFAQPQTVAADGPVCDLFYATPHTVAPGDSLTFIWETTGATAVEINNGVGSVPLDGTTTVTAPASIGLNTYLMTMTYDAYGVDNTVECTAYVEVVPAITVDTPICDFVYMTPAIGDAETFGTVIWETTNTTQFLRAFTELPLDGSFSEQRHPDSGLTNIISLAAVNFNGVSTTTEDCAFARSTYPVTIDLFESSATTVAPGEVFTISWDFYGASYFLINQTSPYANILLGPATSSVSSATTTAPLTPGTYTYNLTVDGAGVEGSGGVATESFDITVVPAPPSLPTCDVFSATPDSVVGSGTTTLSWDVDGADTVTIDNGIGAVASVDSTDVLLLSDTTFELSAVNVAGTTTCSVATTVTAPPQPPSSGGGSSVTRTPGPQCVFFEPSTIEAVIGDTITLSFETKNADVVTIYEGSESENNVVYSVSPGASKAGAVAVTVGEDPVYTLVAERGSRSDECLTQITLVEPSLFDGAGLGRNEGAVLLSEVPDTGYQLSTTSKLMLHILLASGTLFVFFMVLHVGRLGIFATQSTVKYGKFTPISAAADHALRVHRTRSLLTIAALVILIVLLAIQLLF